MIFDNISNIDQYASLGGNFAEAIAFARKAFSEQLPVGHYALNNEKLFANIIERDLVSPPAKWECHAKYADIQLILEGSEVIGICPVSHVSEPFEIDENEDIALFKDLEGTMVKLQAGDFIIALPQDIHLSNGPGKLGPHSKKVVIKVLL